MTSKKKTEILESLDSAFGPHVTEGDIDLAVLFMVDSSGVCHEVVLSHEVVEGEDEDDPGTRVSEVTDSVPVKLGKAKSLLSLLGGLASTSRGIREKLENLIGEIHTGESKQ